MSDSKATLCRFEADIYAKGTKVAIRKKIGMIKIKNFPTFSSEEIKRKLYAHIATEITNDQYGWNLIVSVVEEIPVI